MRNPNLIILYISGYEISQNGVKKLTEDFKLILAQQKENAPVLVKEIIQAGNLTPEGNKKTFVEFLLILKCEIYFLQTEFWLQF